MATISNISGMSHPALRGQVRQTTGPGPDPAAPKVSRGTSEAKSSPSSQASAAGQSTEKGPVTRLHRDQVQDLAVKLQLALDEAAAEAHSVSFRVDPRTEDFVIEIHDPEGELVKQFPPEIMLNLRQKLDELSGMVLDHKS